MKVVDWRRLSERQQLAFVQAAIRAIYNAGAASLPQVRSATGYIQGLASRAGVTGGEEFQPEEQVLEIIAEDHHAHPAILRAVEAARNSLSEGRWHAVLSETSNQSSFGLVAAAALTVIVGGFIYWLLTASAPTSESERPASRSLSPAVAAPTPEKTESEKRRQATEEGERLKIKSFKTAKCMQDATIDGHLNQLFYNQCMAIEAGR